MSINRIKNYIPSFAFKNKEGLWYRMDEEKPIQDKKTALIRKKELVEITGERGFRIIKHQDKYYLYERKY